MTSTTKAAVSVEGEILAKRASKRDWFLPKMTIFVLAIAKLSAKLHPNAPVAPVSTITLLCNENIYLFSKNYKMGPIQ